MVYGLNKEEFNNLVFKTLNKSRISYREIGNKLGINYSTFTRIKQNKDISIDSFIIILNWIRENNFLYWEDLMPKLIKDISIDLNLL